MNDQQATWVYAVVPGAAGGGGRAPGGLTGAVGEPVRLVAAAGVAAVVGSVDRAEVDTALAREPPDPAWLERAARRHHRVVAAFFPRLPTVPFRLGTLYHDDARVREVLAGRETELLTALDAVTGRVEWGVRAYAVATQPGPVGDAAATPRPGTEYLLRRRAERSAREQARRAAGEASQDLDSRLRPLAVAASAHPVNDGAVLSMSYLVDNERCDAFVQTARSLDERHPPLELHLTGPWPAYSFVGLGETAV